MNGTYGRFMSILLIGIETAILLFIIGILCCFFQNLAAANTFANFGLKILVIFGMIATADSFIKLRNTKNSKS